jgi:hypothetical protein
MTVEQILDRLHGVQKTSTGWVAFCPAHTDQAKRSLSISRGRDGRALLKCFTGCLTEAIVAALNITMADLFPDTLPSPSGRAEIEHTYDYTDEKNTLVYQVVRFKPKSFRPRRPDGQGGWIWNLQNAPRRVLYRLPALAESSRVYLCEGEKDADALASWGLPASTTQGGAAQWRGEYVDQLKALAVEDMVMFPDNDEAGDEYVSKASSACLAAGLRVKIVRLPGLVHKGDVSDWIVAGGTMEALLAIVDETPWLEAPHRAAATSVHLSTVLDELTANLERPETPSIPTPYAELTAMLNGGLAPGELVYVGAFAGVGKTALMLEIARLAAKRGTTVLVFSREMTNLALARRLVAQEARVSASGLKRGIIGDGDRLGLAMHLPKMRALPIWLNQVAVSLPELEREVAGFVSSPPLGLVLVDYLQLIRAASDSRSRRDRRLEVEEVSRGLKEIALRYRVPVVCASSMARPRRGPDGKKPPERRPEMDMLRESGELEHDADIVLLLHRDFGADHAECKVAKNRDGRVGIVRLRFRDEFVAFDELRDEDRAPHP